MLIKKSKIFLTVLLTCLLLRNTFGSVTVKAAENSSGQEAQLAETMAKSKEYKAFWFSYYDYDAYRAKYKKRNASTFKKYFTQVVKKEKPWNELCYRTCPSVWGCNVQVEIFSMVKMYFR